MQLHVHLDGSIRPSTFLELFAALKSDPETSCDEAGSSAGFRTVVDIERRLCFQRGWDLPRCLASFATTLRVLQTAEALERVTFELCEDLAADGVVYGEVRRRGEEKGNPHTAVSSFFLSFTKGRWRVQLPCSPMGPPLPPTTRCRRAGARRTSRDAPLLSCVALFVLLHPWCVCGGGVLAPADWGARRSGTALRCTSRAAWAPARWWRPWPRASRASSGPTRRQASSAKSSPPSGTSGRQARCAARACQRAAALGLPSPARAPPPLFLSCLSFLQHCADHPAPCLHEPSC